jgi:AdoMet-dependent heme synthase
MKSRNAAAVHPEKGGFRGPEAVDFDKTPFVAIWETTRACDLACKHCRAEAVPDPLPGELSTEEGKNLLTDLASMGTPLCVLSGGDPAKRSDLNELVTHGAELGMRMATIPAATELLDRKLVMDLKDAGLSQLALSLDGPNEGIHDSFRGVPGSFSKTMDGAAFAREAGLPLQINTTFSDFNFEYFAEIGDLVESLGVVFWEVFFLVPTGRGKELGELPAEKFEELFRMLFDYSSKVDFIVKITEAPHYRRFLMHQAAMLPGKPEENNPEGLLPSHMRRDFGPGGSIGLAPKGVNAGRGHLFVSCTGDIFPSGFLPLPCGNIREASVIEVYRTHPIFQELRDIELLKGKCGICEYRNICGGSRARAFAVTGDYLAVDPGCAYIVKDGRAKV